MSATHDATVPAGDLHTNAPNKDTDVTPSLSSERTIAERDAAIHGQGGVEEKGEGDSPMAAAPAVPAAQDEHPQRTKLQIFLIMFSLAVAVLLVALDITIVTTALPTISAEFNSASGYTWIGSAYLIAQSAATPSTSPRCTK